MQMPRAQYVMRTNLLNNVRTITQHKRIKALQHTHERNNSGPLHSGSPILIRRALPLSVGHGQPVIPADAHHPLKVLQTVVLGRGLCHF
ncbi:hypothetical protein CEXT_509691 [Caerostris extrusa]|uniref:Uncharacterized protein n=1 Tax=Caerostris extrusa TaxID=172846 RepID=A0AAV4U5S0_CAEEX|nr:hypothetical protein CEXT_509691 [Caerostris extrusa]